MDVESSLSSSLMVTTSPVFECNSKAEYYAVIENAGDRLVVVDCFAPWCPPCRQIAPVFGELAMQYTDVVFVKVNVDQVPEIKSILGVWALPTFCFLRFGQKQGSFMVSRRRRRRRRILLCLLFSIESETLT